MKGRVAVVTGAGSGMGRVIALELAERGAKLAAVDIDATRLEHLKEEAGAHAGTFLALPTDTSRAGECRRAVERTVDANEVNGRRFVAKFWDASISPSDAGAKCGAPIAWEGEAAIASRSK